MDTSERYKRLSDDASPLKPDYKIETVKLYEDPVYIKQCEKAEEIQNGVSHDLNFDLLYIQTEDNLVWLPRQDQLQEILGVKNHTFYVGALYKWLKHNNYDQYFDDVTTNPYSSMEQIQLAFLMEKKYSKVWSTEKEDWIEKEINEG